MKISFLIHTVYGIGGTIRTTLNLAEELADRHEIEIVSAFRHRAIPLFDIDPRITVVPLVDTRPKSPESARKHPLHQRPSEVFPRFEARYQEYSELTDQRVRDHYEASDADVVIGTRPGLVAYAAEFAPRGAVVIGQEHMTHNHHKPELREEMRSYLLKVDALVTVSEGDAAVWREQMPLRTTRILAIPNSIPEPTVAPSDLSGNIVVAAGRLSREKQYEVLIKAFAKVVAKHPEWSLRVCGWGTEKERLRKRVQKHLLSNHVQLMGPCSPIDPEWVKGAIAVSTSRHESFGMTLVEAMRNGLPVVSTDCDYGPREIIRDGEDGLLVPVGKADDVADALIRLIEDEELRRTMGAAAIRNARRYDPSAVAKQYADLFAELGAGSSQHAVNGGPDGPAPGPLPAAGGFAPLADCVAEADGSLTVTVVAPEAAALKYRGLRLVCARLGGGADDRVYPFAPDGSVRIPAGDEFAEGQWLCHAEWPEHAEPPKRAERAEPPEPPYRTEGPGPARPPAPGLRTALIARSVDQRGALRAGDRRTPGAGVRHLVPYRRAPQHQLALRSWVRPVHAEAGDVHRSGSTLILEGSVLGPVEPVGEPSLVLRRRGGTGDELVFPGVRQGARGFRVVIDGEEAARRQLAEKDAWEVWLRFAPDREPVRVGRLLDDVVQKGDVFVYPDALAHKHRPLLLVRRVLRRIQRREQRLVRVTLVYEDENDLVLRVVDR
ncbi:glycosyltransferase family 4 protein [Streptomyces katsurahamanus]|uniref:D-inositol 3-phosphate glycosyltransferase n=1 Tax=Streptomyces katsurahamanus TaxID=2577098 RepID=A0ABW9NT48_9ACTN|nr:glycosyltransferase family 4 protein [Streptomyces katsurahamanus]MQS36488.1 glycosyltransferase family 4 protein [Streptomyces katsurahamanus]